MNALLMAARAFALLIFAVAVPTIAFAHSVGTSYISIESAAANTRTARIDISLRDLEFAIGLDANHDAKITWTELQSNSSALNRYIVSHLHVKLGDNDCAFGPPLLEVDTHSDGPYAAMTMPLMCRSQGALTLQSNLLFDIDASHRSLLLVKEGDTQVITVLTNSTRAWTAPQGSSGSWSSFVRFVTQGIWHIWTGFDHLAFLMLLLLPLVRGHIGSRARLIGNILKVVTAFTLAHSLTLACAAFGFANLPSRWVEAAIAASIVITGLMNLSPRASHFGVAMAFGFGLIHGFGFASALAEIAGDTSNRILPVLGFNLGVETGQLVVVAFALPLLFFLTTTSHVRVQRYAVTAGSLGIGFIGLIWLVQRALL